MPPALPKCGVHATTDNLWVPVLSVDLASYQLRNSIMHQRSKTQYPVFLCSQDTLASRGPIIEIYMYDVTKIDTTRYHSTRECIQLIKKWVESRTTG